jgi:hypothetical protein
VIIYYYITYLFFKLNVFFTKIPKLVAYSERLLVFLDAAFQCTLPVLQKPAIPLRHAALLYL